jgi:hypothetical protein
MSELQPYVAKVGDWVNYYANADKKTQNVSTGGSMGGESSQAAPRIESKPYQTVSAPTSAAVPDLLSPTQAAVNQSIDSLKRKRKGGHKKGTKKKRKIVKGKKKKSKKKVTKAKKKTTKGKKNKKKKKKNNSKKGKHPKRKGGKKKKKKKRTSGVKGGSNRKGSLKNLIKRRRQGKGSKKKSATVRDLYPTII